MVNTLRDVVKWFIIGLVFFYGLHLVSVAFGQASLPPRPDFNLADLKGMYTDCQISVSSDDKYISILSARIQVLEKENADLKKTADAKVKP